MAEKKIRTYYLDGDLIDVVYYYDDACKCYFGEYPNFEDTPRYTPNGRPWINVYKEDCPYANEKYNDCGSCQYMKREQELDLIGVCTHEAYRRKDLACGTDD